MSFPNYPLASNGSSIPFRAQGSCVRALRFRRFLGNGEILSHFKNKGRFMKTLNRLKLSQAAQVLYRFGLNH